MSGTDARSFDVVVIGGGSAGYAAALRLRELGRTVALVERDRVGGTCLHRGCVPTKALLHGAEVADVVRNAAHVGVRAVFEGIDAETLGRFRDGIVAGKYKGLQGLLAARGVETIAGTATLEAASPGAAPRVRVGDDVFEGTDVVVATGGVTRTLGLAVGGRVLTSDEALALDEVPTSVVVLGGGVIGVEFASLWRSLGADITIVEALPRLLPTEDAASSKAIERAFRKRGITVLTGTRFASVDQDAEGVTVALEQAPDAAAREPLRASHALVAVGRGPATAGLGLEEAGVTLERGFVVVDELLRTAAPHVWAAGDIVPGPQLAHRGFAHGILVAEAIAGLSPRPVPDSTVPRVTYSDPEVASVGLTTEQATERYGADRIAVSEYNLAGNARSEILGAAGFAKVIREVDGPVVGVHLVGRRVGELISEAQLVVGWEAHPEDIAPYLHAHPTQGEALGEAFLSLAGKPLHGR